MYKTAQEIALHDISIELDKTHPCNNRDRRYIRTPQLLTKTTKRLNKLLGL